MVPQRRTRHTVRYFVYRLFGSLAIVAAVVPFFVYGVSAPVLVFAGINLVIGGAIFFIARGAERHERRAHFTYSTFFSRPGLAAIKIIVLAVVILMGALIIKDEWWARNILVSKWWACGVVVALAVCGEVVSDLREVRRNIHIAVASGRLPRVDGLLAGDPELVNKRGAYGRTPLHLAAALGYVEVAAVLITNGADVTAVADGGWTALHWAAMIGRQQLVRRLVEEGSDVNAKAEDGTTPLNWALRNGHEEAAAVLRLNGAEE